jgi:hypothetical protein
VSNRLGATPMPVVLDKFAMTSNNNKFSCKKVCAYNQIIYSSLTVPNNAEKLWRILATNDLNNVQIRAF